MINLNQSSINNFNNENIKYLNLTNQLKLEILNDVEKYIDDLNKKLKKYNTI